MSDIFNRRCRRSPTVAIRAYVVGLAAVLLASVAWHAFHPYVIRALARSSVGCEARVELIAGAIDELYPRQRVRVLGGKPMLRSYRQGDRGGVSWLMDWGRLRPDQAAVAPGLAAVGDLDLNYCGRLRSQAMTGDPQALPGDWDQDGSIEVMPFAIAAAERGYWSVYWAVVRLGGKANELVGLVAIGSSTAGGAIQATPGWPDEHDDGTFEWVFATMPRPSADGTTSCAEAIAIFEWTEPGGVLRPRVLPDDGSMLIWTPASGRPYPFPADKLVDEVCQELLPVPEGFGAAPASQPASAPTSSPAP
ncbi:MAG TPA: hypothetical protein VM487_21955 [Phycisphaerae bacterium]|nr:hypothetical protein [Phycisphaerae bacterium]